MLSAIHDTAVELIAATICTRSAGVRGAGEHCALLKDIHPCALLLLGQCWQPWELQLNRAARGLFEYRVVHVLKGVDSDGTGSYVCSPAENSCSLHRGWLCKGCGCTWGLCSYRGVSLQAGMWDLCQHPLECAFTSCLPCDLGRAAPCSPGEVWWFAEHQIGLAAVSPAAQVGVCLTLLCLPVVNQWALLPFSGSIDSQKILFLIITCWMWAMWLIWTATELLRSLWHWGTRSTRDRTERLCPALFSLKPLVGGRTTEHRDEAEEAEAGSPVAADPVRAAVRNELHLNISSGDGEEDKAGCSVLRNVAFCC